MLPKYRTAHGTGAVRFDVYEPVYFTPEEIALIVDSPMQRRCGNNGSGEAKQHGHDDADQHGSPSLASVLYMSKHTMTSERR